MTIIETILYCYIITLLFELITAFIIKIRNKKDLFKIFLTNTITNPLMVTICLLIRLLLGLKFELIVLLILEIIVFITEGLIYEKYLNYNSINCFLVSFILNFISYFGGYLVTQFILYPILINNI